MYFIAGFNEGIICDWMYISKKDGRPASVVLKLKSTFMALLRFVAGYGVALGAVERQ